MSNNRSQIGIFKVAATYIGTIVGAGFASGQEVRVFDSCIHKKSPQALI